MKNNKTVFIIFIALGLFTAFIGTINYIKTPETTSLLGIITGIVFTVTGIYRLTVKTKKPNK